MAVGDGVTEVAVGDRVLSSVGLGAWATHAVVRASALTPVPHGLHDTVAAALVQSYCTAWFTLTRRLTVTPGACRSGAGGRRRGGARGHRRGAAPAPR